MKEHDRLGKELKKSKDARKKLKYTAIGIIGIPSALTGSYYGLKNLFRNVTNIAGNE